MSNSFGKRDLPPVGKDGYVSADEVIFLRQNVFADGVVSQKELEAIFALGEEAPDGDQEWPDFFAEATSDFFLHEEEPHGYLTENEFANLKTLVTRDGARASSLELALLVKIMESANATPDSLGDFVGAQIKRVVSEKPDGPSVSKTETDLIRRYLFASGGDGNIAISRAEAELMFDLNDMTPETANDPAWSDLFIKTIANHLMAHVGYEPPSRAEALARQAWLEDQSVNLGGFFRRMFTGGLSAVRDSYARENVASENNAKVEAGISEAEKINSLEADWLAARIGNDGAVDRNERALITYMRELEADLPPKLKELVGKAA